MNSDKEQWREIDSVSRSAGWRIGAWIIAGTLFVGLVAGGVWAFKVVTSDAKGAGDATRQINDGRNRIAAQEVFEAMYAQIQAHDRNLDQAAKDKADHPGDTFFATNYSGLVKTCNEAVLQYNAETRKVSKAKWLSEDLPFEIDQTDVRFDCKESGK